MTRSLSSNFLKDYDTNGIVRHLRNKGCKGWGLSEELGAIHKRRRNILGGKGGLKFRCCKILEGGS